MLFHRKLLSNCKLLVWIGVANARRGGWGLEGGSTVRLPDLIRNVEERAEIGPYKEEQGGGGNT